jgi:hypothetical protein
VAILILIATKSEQYTCPKDWFSELRKIISRGLKSKWHVISVVNLVSIFLFTVTLDSSLAPSMPAYLKYISALFVIFTIAVGSTVYGKWNEEAPHRIRIVLSDDKTRKEISGTLKKIKTDFIFIDFNSGNKQKTVSIPKSRIKEIYFDETK